MDEDKKSYLIGKKVHLEISKDGQRLIYTAHILDVDNLLVTFLDKKGLIYTFPKTSIAEIQVLEGVL